MSWSKEIPTTPGFYWMSYKYKTKPDSQFTLPDIIEVYSNKQFLTFEMASEETFLPEIFEYRFWKISRPLLPTK